MSAGASAVRTHVITLGMAATVMLVAVSAVAQEPLPDVRPVGDVGGLDGYVRAHPRTGPVPRLPDGRPDLTGVWLGGSPPVDIAMGLPKGDALPYLPETKKKVDAQAASDDPQAHCLPLPPPRGLPYPWRIVVTPTHAFFLYEMYNYRQVFLDGRKHPSADELFPTWYGHSIGRWEGDTLVVDTVGMNDKTWFDNKGDVHTEKLHLTERYTRTDLGQMRIEYTIDDPGAYSKPFTVKSTALLMPADEELHEYICNENNQDVPYLQGRRPAGDLLRNPPVN